MRVCLDTNLIVSGLSVGTRQTQVSPPARLLELWFAGRFTLVTSNWQLAEFARVSRYERVRARLPAHVAGRFVNVARAVGVVVDALPVEAISNDPDDDFIIATAVNGQADVLASGDLADVLKLKSIGRVQILSARELLDLLEPHANR